MKRKYLRLLFALVLVCSLGLVTAVPAAASPAVGDVNIVVQDQEGNPIEGAEARIFWGGPAWKWMEPKITDDTGMATYNGTEISEWCGANGNPTLFQVAAKVSNGVYGNVYTWAVSDEMPVIAYDDTQEYTFTYNLVEMLEQAPTLGYDSGTGEVVVTYALAEPVTITDVAKIGFFYGPFDTSPGGGQIFQAYPNPEAPNGYDFYYMVDADEDGTPGEVEDYVVANIATDNTSLSAGIGKKLINEIPHTVIAVPFLVKTPVEHLGLTSGEKSAAEDVYGMSSSETFPLLVIKMVSLDAHWYKTGDVATVRVQDEIANTDPGVRESIGVHGYSQTLEEMEAPSVTIALQETGPDTGIFKGTFKLVGTTPGTGEVLVSHGDWCVAYYTPAEMGDGAMVDDAVPTINNLTPADEAFETSAMPAISATLDDPLSGIDWDNATMTVDGDVVDAVQVDGDLSYTPSTDLDEGIHTVIVGAPDRAGNPAETAEWSFTMDSIAPAITEQASDPKVIMPNEETEVVFSANIVDATSGVDTVTIDLSPVGGGEAVPMLDEDSDDIYTASGNITKAAEGNYPLTITATDEATNSDAADITLGVWSDITDPVITSPAITYEYGSSARPGDVVIISANVIDDIGIGPSGNVTATCDVFIDTIELLDNGVLPDVTADDGIYTVEAEVDEAVGWGDYTITLTATDDKGNDAIDESLTLAVRSGATGYELELVEGWNLISLPLIPDDSAIAVVISADTLVSANVSHIGIVRGYDPATGDFPYYMPESGIGDLAVMEDGIGYWVFMNEDDTLTITGRQMPAPPEVPPTYDVVVGWNLIGFKSMEDDTDTNYLANIVETYPVLWSYNAVTGAYENVKDVADGMEVGHGFWIWITEAGTIVPPQ